VLFRSTIDGIEYKIHKSEIIRIKEFIHFKDVIPGTVIASLYDNSLVLATKDDFLRIFIKEK
jgi:hypothetical protein